MTWRCLATVLRVVDGDTFACDFDLGWGVYMHEVKGRPNRVRILGLDTPERGQPGHLEARNELATVLRSPPLIYTDTPTQVWVTSQKLDSFGRTLADVTTLEGVDVRGAMREEWWV